MYLQYFPPTHYMVGGATRVHVRNDLYPICLNQSMGALYGSSMQCRSTLRWFLDNSFFLLSVGSLN